MNNQSFDKACKDKLNSISEKYYIPDWDNFSEKFNASNSNPNDIEDIVFDRTVSEKLNQLPQTSMPQYLFNQVYQDFIFGQWRKHNIYVIKICEMVVVLLILITFKNHFIPQEPLHNERHDVYAHYYDIWEEGNVKCQTLHAKTPLFHKKSEKDDNSNIEQSVSSVFVHSLKYNSDYYPFQLNSETLHTQEDRIQDSTISQKVNKVITFIDDIQKQATNLYEVHTEQAEIFPLVLSEMEKPMNLAYEFSLGTGFNAYQINTPFDRVYSIASYRKETMSPVLAAGIGMTRDRWSVLSGLEYARLYYRPEIISEPFNMQPELFFETSLKSIQYDLIHIPLKLRYTLLSSPHAGFYAEAGISTHLIWEAAYDVETIVRSGRPSVRYVEETPRLEDKNFTPGLSNNHLLKDNYFSGALIGLGGDIKLWNNLKIYGQVLYSRHFIGDKIGIGPNDDRIHYASGQFGLRWSIR